MDNIRKKERKNESKSLTFNKSCSRKNREKLGEEILKETTQRNLQIKNGHSGPRTVKEK